MLVHESEHQCISDEGLACILETTRNIEKTIYNLFDTIDRIKTEKCKKRKELCQSFQDDWITPP